MPPIRRLAVSAGCVVAVLAMPLPALAASSGVHVDPNSPPGKEYAIPLQSARSQGASRAVTPASGGAPTGGGQRRRPPPPVAPAADSGLFGAGISRPSRHHATPAQSPNRSAAAPAAPVLSASDRRPAGQGGGSTAFFWIVGALAVLIPGLAVGLGVRRWRNA